MAPMTAEGTFLINLAKFKAHQMGITGAIKTFRELPVRNFTSTAAAIMIFSRHMINVIILSSSPIT